MSKRWTQLRVYRNKRQVIMPPVNPFRPGIPGYKIFKTGFAKMSFSCMKQAETSLIFLHFYFTFEYLVTVKSQRFHVIYRWI